jgi:vancomycin resistance protein YoaR
MSKNKREHLFVRPWLVVVIVAVAILALLVIIILLGLNFYNQKTYPGLYLGDEYIGSMEMGEVADLIDEYSQQLNTQGFVCGVATNLANVNSQRIYPTFIAADPDLSRQIIEIKKAETLAEIYQAGRQGNFFQRLVSIFNNWREKKKFDLITTVDEVALKNILVERFAGAHKEYINTRVYIDANGMINFIAGQDGYFFDYQKAILDFKNRLANLSLKDIKLQVELKKTEVSLAEAERFKPKIEELIKRLPLKFIYEDRQWEADKSTLAEWFVFTKQDNQVSLDLDEEKVSLFLALMAEEIDQAPQEPKAEFDSSRATLFQAPRDGLTLNQESVLAKIKTEFMAGEKQEIELDVEVVSPKTAFAGSNKLGIQEIVGVGRSNFAGSPTNRRHNIATGAAALNGLLIAPGEEFSTIETLGEINAQTGYLPELVIKGNRTIPEYGGGLCQIGTTVFRAAINAGLPITERQPHSYRVGYYEPAGTDATIYQPHPDMRFVNDTGQYLVWQTYIVGDELIFELWGTSDGRQVTVSDPTIYNITSPGEIKEIETTELAPGERKKIESAHNGADAKFTRKIVYTDSSREPVDEVFESHYTAWRETWLVGVEAVEEPTEPETTDGQPVVYDNPFTKEDESLSPPL